MTSSVYQATVEELEALLSPRVVSRSLKDGLELIGKTPQAVSYDDLEKILKSQVYRQLQVAMPVSEAKTRIQDILTRLKNLEVAEAEQDVSDQALSTQSEVLENLKTQLKPFNLYFEWSEVQKLRALIQLLEVEQEADREAAKLVTDARAQLKIVQQKLEDELVHQAKELNDLEATFETTKTLGGIKVRRFENLLKQIRAAQDNRQLATAELERSKKLAIDLRKLMESSIVIEDEMPDAIPDAIPDANDGLIEVESEADDLLVEDHEDIEARIAEIDLEGESYTLDTIANENKTIISYLPELKDELEQYRQKLASGESVAEGFEDLKKKFAELSHKQRNELVSEIEQIAETIKSFNAEVVDAELEQSLKINLGILEATLPKLDDIKHLRNLYRLAKEKNTELEKQKQAKRQELAKIFAEQKQALANFAEPLAEYKDKEELLQEYTVFAKIVASLQKLHNAKKVSKELLARAQAAQIKLESALAERAQEEIERKRALLKALLGELRALPVPESLKEEAKNIENKIVSYANNLDESYIADETIDESAAAISKIKKEIQNSYLADLDVILSEADSKGLKTLSSEIAQAKEDLKIAKYPNINEYKTKLAKGLENLQQEQINDLRQLTQELDKYKGINIEGLDELYDFASDAQALLAIGKTVAGFDDMWLKLEALRNTISEKTANFIPQLDQALIDFKEISKLNSEDVSSVGLILKHLDEQRDSFDKVSVGVQGQLVNSLIEAQDLIESLKEQLEATKAIAGKLANTNVLDNLFGSSFDISPKLEPSPEPELIESSSPTQGSKLSTGNTDIDSLITDYCNIKGVKQMAIFDKDKMLAGQFDASLENISTKITELDEYFTLLGGELKLKRHKMAIYSMQNKALTIAWPSTELYLIIISDVNSLGLISQKLARDIDTINNLVQASIT
ncbi:MAG TPA: hypothetical protein ENK21_07545 [Trueperaceae bacterium]|nr:hypothetical protein [Trueperaceae bacterium]